MLDVSNISVYFGKKNNPIKALDGVSACLFPGKITALAGESGCGKTTLAKTILRFHKPWRGKIYLRGKDITLKNNERYLRKNIQIVFQNPFSSVDSRYPVFSALYEALTAFKKIKKNKAESIIERSLRDVGLTGDIMFRYPYQLSGGQVQRVCIARALINHPSLVILDEPTSSLDVTTASKIVLLLKRIQRDSGAAFLFISHNLRILKRISDFCFIMYAGKIVEYGPKHAVYGNPLHPYTRLLLKASYYNLKRIEEFSIPEAGCPFLPRCSQKADFCRRECRLREIEPGHYAACCNA